MSGALDEIAFLANSENRVAVFEALVEVPHSRDELLDDIDASRVTITRVLRELEDRDWIAGTGQEYVATPLGEWVCEEFVQLVEVLETETRLREPLRWFPSELLTFDVRCLRDAEVVVLDPSDATAVVRRIIEFHRSSDHVRGLTRVTAPVLVENYWQLTVDGDTRLENVITPGVLGVIVDHPPSARRVCEMLHQENVSLSVHEEVPFSLEIVDGAVSIDLTDEAGGIKGRLVSEDDTVRAWAVDLFERYHEESRPVTPEEITV